MKNVVLPDSLEIIEVNAFSGCKVLTEIVLPKNLKTIQSNFFGICPALEKIVISEKTTDIQNYVFSSLDDWDHGLSSPKIVIFGRKNSAAEKYAVKNNLPFREIIDTSGVTLNTRKTSLDINETFQINTIVTPANATVNAVRYKNSDKNIISVSRSGLIKAVRPGTATISAVNFSGQKAECIVTAYPGPTGIILSKGQMSLGLNETFRLSASLSPSAADISSLKWRSSDAKILSADQNGNVKAVGKGTAWITARTKNGLESSCKITVKNSPDVVRLEKTVLTLGVGETFRLSSVIPADSASASRKFRTSCSSIVQMTKTDWEGHFRAVKPGTAFVTVRLYNGKEASCRINVKKAPTSVCISRKSISMKVGHSGSLSSVIPVETGCASRIFRTSNSSVIKMTKTNWTGQFTAVKKGVAWVTVRTFNGKESSCRITVE